MTFPEQSIAGDTACFNVSLLTDNDVEGLEFFLLSLTSSATSLVTVSPDQSEATVNIRDLTGELVGSSTVVCPSSTEKNLFSELV